MGLIKEIRTQVLPENLTRYMHNVQIHTDQVSISRMSCLRWTPCCCASAMTMEAATWRSDRDEGVKRDRRSQLKEALSLRLRSRADTTGGRNTICFEVTFNEVSERLQMCHCVISANRRHFIILPTYLASRAWRPRLRWRCVPRLRSVAPPPKRGSGASIWLRKKDHSIIGRFYTNTYS